MQRMFYIMKEARKTNPKFSDSSPVSLLKSDVDNSYHIIIIVAASQCYK